jgi:2-methylisocitrate lyase-like PEP mutase family enzyme
LCRGEPRIIASQAFAALHQPGSPFPLPNAWDVASALFLADAGFPAVGTTSLGVTTAAGEIDGDGTGRDLTMALARAILPRLAVLVTIDLENGYSDAVADLTAELAELGAAGINLEDGRGRGELRATAAHAAIIRAVGTTAPNPTGGSTRLPRVCSPTRTPGLRVCSCRRSPNSPTSRR